MLHPQNFKYADLLAYERSINDENVAEQDAEDDGLTNSGVMTTMKTRNKEVNDEEANEEEENFDTLQNALDNLEDAVLKSNTKKFEIFTKNKKEILIVHQVDKTYAIRQARKYLEDNFYLDDEQSKKELMRIFDEYVRSEDGGSFTISNTFDDLVT